MEKFQEMNNGCCGKMTKQLSMGIKVEAEHSGTLKFIKRYYNKHGKMPTQKEIFRHIASDHLREDPKYYTKLKKAKL